MRNVMVVLIMLAAGCSRSPRTVMEVVALSRPKLPALPDDPAWDQAPEHVARMVPQDLVEPRLMTPSTAEVKIRALADGSGIAFRLAWEDDTKSDLPGPASMIDACAVQIPEKIGKDLPEPQMGQEGKRVQIAYWRADWQAAVDGRGDTIRDLYPNASIDHYPFEARPLEKGSPGQKEMALRYAPARSLGNARSGPRAKPVEEMVAEGPGTLANGPSFGAFGKGVFGKTGWLVVLGRKRPAGLEVNQRTHVAFAVWQGSKQEAGARKMRTGWIPLVLRVER
jgi:hypothetical protein